LHDQVVANIVQAGVGESLGVEREAIAGMALTSNDRGLAPTMLAFYA